jgi:hypothetical protein
LPESDGRSPVGDFTERKKIKSLCVLTVLGAAVFGLVEVSALNAEVARKCFKVNASSDTAAQRMAPL